LREGLSFFSSEDLQNLGVGEAICRIEKAEYDFNLKTYPIRVKTEAGTARDIIKAMSRGKYGKARKEIEEELKKAMEVSLEEPEEETASPSSAGWRITARKPSPAVHVQERSTKEIPVEPVKEEKIPTPPDRKETILVSSFADESREKRRQVLCEQDEYLMGQGGRKHKEIQNMIKTYAEERGFRVTIEKEVKGGKVDVVLERADQPPIACEVSVTTSPEQEFKNLRKCLAGNFQHVILVSAERKTLNKVQKLASEELEEEEMARIQFLVPEDFFFFLNTIAAEEATRAHQETVISGYRVKVQYTPLTMEEEKSRRESIIRTIGQSILRREREKDKR